MLFLTLIRAAKYARFKWYKDHCDWNSVDRSRVLFTDESIFCSESDSNLEGSRNTQEARKHPRRTRVQRWWLYDMCRHHFEWSHSPTYFYQCNYEAEVHRTERRLLPPYP
ncbi:hypothetical protein AVEN_181871-1 [Araneus ventricosus]|uniref:Uncharacterized protein n=1 Tax=Araneus ventricosus TaxID=182803 RepID=A0A4Y2C384_ARAVE|nr:hypothetical protein AVEN_181871-1 [Araneus ventricosus]